MMRRYFWLVFTLVFAWNVALFIFIAQPVPANDAFFYDGAAVHYLQHGGYFNPTLALALPISGHKLFSAYPPLYQLPLIGWMSVFGTSAYSVMAMHLVLFGLYLVVLLAILRRLQVPAWCINLAGGFLLALTFHDRPDSLAHLLGILAVYAAVRSSRVLNSESPHHLWIWVMASLIVLTLCTSLQVGGTYLVVIFIATLAASLAGKEPIPFVPLSFIVLAPIALVLLVEFTLPEAWAGFKEHASQTPTLTGLRSHPWQDALKITRTIPGILMVMVLLPFSWLRLHDDFSGSERRCEIILWSMLLPAIGIIFASLFFLTSNDIGIAAYLQPVIVAAYLGFSASLRAGPRWQRVQVWCLIPAVLLCSVRAIGMTTWGVASANDVSYWQATQRVEHELANEPSGGKVVMSSAFLYDAMKHSDLDLIHSDWLEPAKTSPPISDSQSLMTLRPEKIIVTQFDYYRRYQYVLEQLDTNAVGIEVINTARTRAPDSYPALRQVVQHISWAPVIVNLAWRTGK